MLIVFFFPLRHFFVARGIIFFRNPPTEKEITDAGVVSSSLFLRESFLILAMAILFGLFNRIILIF